MYQRMIVAGLMAALAPLTLRAQTKPVPSKDLRIVTVDADGGAAVLIMTPEGKSLLIDTGWPVGHGAPRPTAGGASAATPAAAVQSDADRIAAAAETLGVKKIDYLLITHYHVDHIGGIQALLAKLPVGTIIDHGPNRETVLPDLSSREATISPAALYPGYLKAITGYPVTVPKVGDKLDVGSLHIEFVTSDGDVLHSPLPGAGQPNSACAGVPQKGPNGGEENVRSLGMVMTFGKTSILYLGDLTWNKEIELLCPVNKIGKVDVYFVTGHGMDISSAPPTVALDSTVAVMQNGSRKGGDEAVIKTVDSFPDMKGFWRLHYSTRYPDMNGDPNYIANPDGPTDDGFPIDLDITPKGQITVTNMRNNFSKTYEARGAK